MEYHKPVLFDEVIDNIITKKDAVYVDCTLGGGGHIRAAGATVFTECGPGKALQGMISKICKGNSEVSVQGASL